MLLTTLIVLTTLLPRIEGTWDALRARLSVTVAAIPGASPSAEVPQFLAEARAVSNWRGEAGDWLRPASLALVVRHATTEPAFVARCVRLNNYWCIKSAHWSGEIGADAEGHTGFATAADGADAAVRLLSRYYGTLNRRTALAIVRRWAPAECRVPGAAAMPAPASASLAPRGLRRTLRARYLARHALGGGPRRALGNRGGSLRIQPWSPLARMAGRRMGTAAQPPADATASRLKAKAPSVAASRPNAPGLLIPPSEILAKPSVILTKPSQLLVNPSVVLGAAPEKAPTAWRSAKVASLQQRFVAESASLPAIAAGLPNIPLLDLSVPAPLCANDETRIRNYAARIAGSVGLRSDDDLKLFGSDGRALPNLAPVLLAMSGVELGTLRAGPALVAAALARLDMDALGAAGAKAAAP